MLMPDCFQSLSLICVWWRLNWMTLHEKRACDCKDWTHDLSREAAAVTVKLNTTAETEVARKLRKDKSRSKEVKPNFLLSLHVRFLPLFRTLTRILMDLATFNKEAQLLFVSPFVLFFSHFLQVPLLPRVWKIFFVSSEFWPLCMLMKKLLMTQGNKIIRLILAKSRQARQV